MTDIQDLRSYLDLLESRGNLIRISQPVDLEHELANIAVNFQRQFGKACLFENPQNSKWPVFANAVSTPVQVALALQCEVDEIIGVMENALDTTAGIPPKKVKKALWMENTIVGDDINLWDLPIPVHGEHDGGPFITGGITVAKDPVSGRGNLSYNRMQILGKSTFGFNVNEWRHVMEFYRHQEAQDQGLEIAISIGVDPAISIAAGARYPDDELMIVGAIRGTGIPVCRGIKTEINIPANAEVVIEGYLPPHQRKLEGPLAEFHGYYGELWDSPIFEVTAIHYRDDPIFQTIIPGEAEHIYIGNVLSREPLLRQFVNHVSPNITGLHIPPYGNGFSVLIQLDKKNPGEPKNVALAAFTGHVNIKKAIIVDPDVNIYDPADVLWAMTNRVDWSLDTFVVPGSQGHEMDPTANERGIHTKIGIDATYKPERRDYGERIRYPSMDLSRYIK